MRHQAGYQLLELLTVLAILGLATLMTAPSLLDLAGATRVELASAEVARALHLARGEAVRRGATVGVKFFTDAPGGPEYRLFADGDGDGVRSDDIRRGIDPPIGPARRLAHLGRGAGFGFPPDVRPRDPGDPSRRLAGLDDPIRLNRSDIASFAPLGTSTPGSLYLTDGRRHLAVVRIWGRTAKIRRLRWDAGRDRWK